jgi:ABC-type glycerol-3-phosphate transport system permease component
MEVHVGDTFHKRLIIFCTPLFLFLVALLLPFYWMLIAPFKPDFKLYNVRNAPSMVSLSAWCSWDTITTIVRFF